MPVVYEDNMDENWWMIDSGASATVVSANFLSRYAVVKSQDLPPRSGPGFAAASGDVKYPTQAVRLKATFKMMSNPKDIIYQDCLITAFVAEVSTNILSLGTLMKKNWDVGSCDQKLEVSHRGYRLDIKTWQNVPWILHYDDPVGRGGSSEMHETFCLDHQVNRKFREKQTERKSPELLMGLKRRSDFEPEDLDRLAAEMDEESRENADLVKAYEDELHESELPAAFSSSTEPSLSSAKPGPVRPSVVRKKQLKIQDLDQHRRQGRFPYHPDCLACQAAKSTNAHRRKAKTTLSAEIACDFMYIKVHEQSKESYKYLVMADLVTGMKGVVPVENDVRVSHQWIRSWLGEFNLLTPAKEPIEVIADAEDAVAVLLKGAIDHRAVSFVKAPPQGHQTVGGAESCVRTLKDSLGALRQDLRENGCDLDMKSRKSVNAALAYLCQSASLFSGYLDTKKSPKSIALGREITRVSTLFGSTVLAELPDSVKSSGDSVSRFAKATFLRPELNSLGYLVVTMLNGVERIFTAKSIKVLNPMIFDPALATGFLITYNRSQHVKFSDRPEVRKIGDASKDVPAEPKVFAPKDLATVKNVPSDWIKEHGKTKGCSVCQRFDSFRGKIHNKCCVDRYKAWLREQSKVEERSSVPGSASVPASAPALLDKPLVPESLSAEAASSERIPAVDPEVVAPGESWFESQSPPEVSYSPSAAADSPKEVVNVSNDHSMDAVDVAVNDSMEVDLQDLAESADVSMKPLVEATFLVNSMKKNSWSVDTLVCCKVFIKLKGISRKLSLVNFVVLMSSCCFLDMWFWCKRTVSWSWFGIWRHENWDGVHDISRGWTTDQRAWSLETCETVEH